MASGQVRFPKGFRNFGGAAFTAPADVIFVNNLAQTLEIQEEATKEAALAAGKTIRGYIKNVRLKDGFKGTREDGPLEFLDDISVEFVEDSDPPEVRVGLKEEDAPSRPYPTFWELGHWNVYTEEYERERWLEGSMQKSRSVQANAATSAAETQLSLKKQLTGFTRGFAVFAAVDILF